MDEFLKSISSVIGVEVSALKEAAEGNKAVSVDGTFFTQSELTDSNNKVANTAKSEHFAVITKNLGVEANDIEGLGKAVAAKYADSDSQEAIKKLNSDLESRNNEFEALTGEARLLKSENNSLKVSIKLDSVIPEGYALTSDAKKTLFLSSNKVGFSESGDLILIGNDGNPKLDAKNKTISVTSESFTSFLESQGIPKLETQTADETQRQTRIVDRKTTYTGKHANINNLKQLNEYAEKNGINIGSVQYSNLMVDVQRTNPNYKTSKS